MKITAEMLFGGLRRSYKLHLENVGKPGQEVKHIVPWKRGEPVKEDTLYLVEEADVLQKSACHLSCFLVCRPCIGLPRELSGDTYAVLGEKTEIPAVHIALLEIYNRLQSWDARFYEAVLHQKDPRTVMSWGREVLEWEYAVIDRDMNILYCTPEYGSYVGGNLPYLSQELVQSLLMNPDFHAAAGLKTSFYYYEEMNDYHALCGNVFVNDQYYARIVMYIGEKGSMVPEGAREIFEIFVSHIEDLVKYNRAMMGRQANDPLRQLFRSLAAGENPSPVLRASVLKKAGWRDDDLYTVIKLKFYEDAGWNTQLSTTLPYLTRELECEWKDSCAIIDETAVLWVINMRLSEKETDWSSLRQRLAFFVRDHVCNAGVSPQFRAFSLIPYAVKAADVALRIGQTENPDFWCYHFDDYRLAYMLERVQEELPSSLLCHPAILQLISYDQECGTELARTLGAYLQCNLNMTTAAQQLYVHRTTFCRRMDHIRKLTGIDIRDKNTILSLLISYRLFSV